MAKKFYFRGHTIEELKEMSISEFAEILPSKERRKIRRGFTEQERKLISRMERKDAVKTHCRAMIVLPFMVGKSVNIYRGDGFVQIFLNEEMVGHRFGEFVMTRKKLAHNAPGVGATRSSASVSVR